MLARNGLLASVPALILALLAGCATTPPGDPSPTSAPETPSSGEKPTGESPPGKPAAETADTTWEWFSDRGRVFAPLRADPREAQVRIGFLGDFHGHRYLEADFGGDLGLLHTGSPSAGEEFSLTVRALVASRFEFFSESFDLLNIDFRGGLAAGYRRGEDTFELFAYHQSSHLGDEIQDRDDRDRIDYSRETVRVLWSRRFDDLRVYLGAMVHVRADPVSIQGGGGLQLGLGDRFEILGLPIRTDLDVQTRSEDDWCPGIAAMIGLDLGDPEHVLRPQRVFVELYTGPSRMGQFYDDSETTLGFGISWVF